MVLKWIAQTVQQRWRIWQTTGVANATVSFMTQKMKVEFEDEADEKTVMKQVLKNCRKVEDDCDIFF